MNGKITLYIGLIAIGLAAIGAGLWFLFNTSSTPVMEQPEGEPVITMNIRNDAAGTATLVSVYSDRTIISRENDGFRSSAIDEDYPATSVWKAGKLTQEEMNGLTAMFNSSDFLEMDAYIQPTPGDMPEGLPRVILSFDYENTEKKVTAYDYEAAELPQPLKGMCKTLVNIINNKLEEVYRETY